MSKLFHLKKWLTLPEVAARLSNLSDSEVAESDILRLALDGHLTISVNFVNHVAVRDVMFENDSDTKCKDYSVFAVVDELKGRDKNDESRLRFTGAGDTDHTVLSLSANIVYVSGLHELIVCGDGARELERRYYANAGTSTLASSSRPGILVIEASTVYQLQENLDDATEVVGSSAHGDMIRKRIAAEVTPTQETAHLLALHDKRAEVLKAEGRNLRDFFYPALSLPSDSVLVVRADDLAEFERTHLSVETPGVLDSMTPNSDLLKRGFINVATAACILADRWVDPDAKEENFIESGQVHDFAKGMVASMNTLLRECAEGRIQAYAPSSGMPMRHGDYDHTCLIRFEELDDWCAANGVVFSEALSSPALHTSAVTPPPEIANIAPPSSLPYAKVGWAMVLYDNITKIDALHGGDADVSQVIRWLKKHGAPSVTNEGGRDEIVWIDKNGTRKVRKAKTVSNTMPLAREYARSQVIQEKYPKLVPAEVPA